jgi:hypothetical protein
MRDDSQGLRGGCYSEDRKGAATSMIAKIVLIALAGSGLRLVLRLLDRDRHG